MLGGLLVGFGLFGFLTGNGFGDIWTALIGWFVIDASRAEEQAAASPAPSTVTPSPT